MNKILIAVFMAAVTLCSFNANGQNWLWAQSAAQGGNTEGTGIATDNDGNVYAIGYYFGYIKFGTDSFPAIASDAFIVKYNHTGNLLWAKQISGTYNENVYGLAVDPWGNAVVAGVSTSPNLLVDGSSFNNPLNSYGHSFVLRFNAAGNLQWAKFATSTQNDAANAVAVDHSGNIFVTGEFDSPFFTFGNDTAFNSSSSSSDEIYLSKLDSSGIDIWTKSAGGSSNDKGLNIAVDNIGNIYITGYFFSNTIQFGNQSYNGVDTAGIFRDGFLAKYDAGGHADWVKIIGDSLWVWGTCVAPDNLGNIYWGGIFRSDNVMFDTVTLTNMTATGSISDIFICKLDNSGNYTWAKSFGGTDKDEVFNLAIDDNNNVYMAGGYSYAGSSDMYLDSVVIPYPVNGMDPEFVAMLNGAGEVLCTNYLSSGGDDVCGLALNNYGEVFTGGDFFNINGAFVVGNDSILPMGTGGIEQFFVAAFSECSQCPNEIHTTTINASICAGEIYTLPSGIQVNAAGIYNDTINTNSGCDSVVVTTLTVNTINAIITQNGTTLNANNITGATYQWIDCNNNNTAISGATNASYIATSNGDYAVIITLNGCSDTSLCKTVIGESVSALTSNFEVMLYPNPVNNILFFTVNLKNRIELAISIKNILGETLKTFNETNTTNFSIDVKNLPDGIYFLSLKNNSGESCQSKFVVQH